MQGCYQSDITTFEESKIDMATSQFILSQIMREPAHILSNSASCIDLIFTSQPNFAMHYGVHPSLHLNYHHQIAFAKFNLTIFYLPSYKQLIWHYQQANSDLIKWAIGLFDCEKSISNLDVNIQVSVFNKTIILKVLFHILPGWTKASEAKKVKLKMTWQTSCFAS